MPEDKLSRAERIRLESFAQATNTVLMTRDRNTRPTLGELFTQAEQIEAWLKKANESVQ